jgi:predicted phage terminase large subunit-like protein
MPPTVLTSRKSQPDASVAALRHLILTDLYFLARRILYKDSATPMTKEFHQAVCLWRSRSPYKRNLYLLSRDHLKTSLLTVAANVQRVLKDPTTRILLASDKAGSAEGQLAEIKGHLVNPLLVRLFPDVLFDDPWKEAVTWSQSAISVKRPRETKEATIETIGVEGASTGKHYDHGSFDDLVDEQNSRTRDLLESTVKWYQTAQSLFEPNATQDIVGTPWEFGDLYDWMIQQRIAGNFKVGIYRQPCWKVREPGVLRLDAHGGIAEDEYLRDKHGELAPAYPEKHTAASLDERRRINPRIFAAQWLLRPVDDASAMFPRGQAVIKPRSELPSPANLWSVMCVDPAISTKAWADYSAIAVLGFADDGMMYVQDLRRGRWTEDQLIDEVYGAYQRTPGIRVVGFEAVGFQKLYMNEFRRASEERGVWLPLLKLERDNKLSKAVRIRGLQPAWASQQIVFADDLPALGAFLEEAERFRPWKESVHDDLLDALADCLQMRVRPDVEDPDAGLDDDTRESVQLEREIQAARPAGSPPLDRGSLRAARLTRRRLREMEHGRENATANAEMAEFYGSG